MAAGALSGLALMVSDVEGAESLYGPRPEFMG